MIDYYDREQIYSLIEDSWRSLEKRFKETPKLYESAPKLRHNDRKSKCYYSDSSIRKFGAEPYLQAALFAEITRRHPDSENFVLGVEGKNFNGKRPDILAWNPNSDPDQENPYFVIELKVVGSALLYGKSLFVSDMNKYKNIGKTFLFFGCYYEGDPTDILDIKENHGSVLNWAINEKNLDVSTEFKKSVIEGYGFRGDCKWEVFNNR